MAYTETKQQRPSRLMLGLSIFIIIFGIITICSPSLFWKFMDIILGFFVFLAGISTMIKAFRNKNNQLGWLLGFGGFLLALIGFGLIFSWSHVVGTIMIWIFAIWALIRGVMLIIFGLNSRENQPLRWAILGLGGLLFVLAIVIAISDKSEARSLAGVCIGISTVLDGISLLIVAIKVKDNPSLQSELLNKANQNEIAQGDVVVTEAVVITSSNPENAEVNVNNAEADLSNPGTNPNNPDNAN